MNSKEIFTFSPDKSEINVNLKNITKTIGYKTNEFPDEYNQLLTNLYNQALDIISPKCGFIFLSNSNIIVDKNSITINEVILNTERIVAFPLKNIQSLIIFTATIGEKFDFWSKETFNSGDPLSGYFIDLIGSELAENVVDWLEAKIISYIELQGKFCSNRYSPGYCGWSVSDQQKLFNFLPKNFCGITLTSSSLMKPHKSVSGIIGVGEKIKRIEYPCNVCKVKHCYKNRTS